MAAKVQAAWWECGWRGAQGAVTLPKRYLEDRGALSTGDDNELIDNLKEAQYIHSELEVQAF